MAKKSRKKKTPRRRSRARQAGIAALIGTTAGIIGFRAGRKQTEADRGKADIGRALPRFITGRTFERKKREQRAFRASLKNRSESLLANFASIFGF